MELYQLEYFRKLCEFGKFSKTADYFHVTQPSISIAIKKLETELGGDLINHNSKIFQITPMGIECLSYANRIHMEIENMHAALEQYGHPSHKVIRTGMPLSMYSDIVSALSNDFSVRHPEIPIYISHASPEYISESILSGNLDIGITFDVLANKLSTLPLRRTEFAAYVAPDHKYHSFSEITPDLLAGEVLLVSREAIGIGKCFHDYFNQFDFEAHYLNMGNLLPQDAFLSAMKGRGIAFLPKKHDPEYAIPLNPPLYVNTSIAWQKDKVLTKDQRLLTNFMLSLQI